MRRKKNRDWIIVVCAVIATVAVLPLFDDDTDTTAASDPKPFVTTSGESTTELSAKPPRPSGIPSPDAAQTEALIRALRAVEPELVAEEDRAVDRARNVCLDITGGKDAATIQSNAKTRFEGGTVPSLTDDQAGDIVTAVRSSFCN